MEVTSKLKRAVECAICLETFVNLKSLQCNHTYCKSCLDEIAQFDEDGSVTIQCPKACPENTHISNTQPPMTYTLCCQRYLGHNKGGRNICNC